MCHVAGQKVYGIDKTLLVPLVQPSVDIVQGQVSEPDLSLLFLAAYAFILLTHNLSCTSNLKRVVSLWSMTTSQANMRIYLTKQSQLCMIGEGNCSREAISQAFAVWP